MLLSDKERHSEGCQSVLYFVPYYQADEPPWQYVDCATLRGNAWKVLPDKLRMYMSLV